jgi:hypothetical protein
MTVFREVKLQTAGFVEQGWECSGKDTPFARVGRFELIDTL